MSIKDTITFFGMSVIVLIPITLMANGIGPFSALLGAEEEKPLIV